MKKKFLCATLLAVTYFSSQGASKVIMTTKFLGATGIALGVGSYATKTLANHSDNFTYGAHAPLDPTITNKGKCYTPFFGTPSDEHGFCGVENLRAEDGHGYYANPPKKAYDTQDRMLAQQVGAKKAFAVCDGHGKDHGHDIAEKVIQTIPRKALASKNTKESFISACKEMQEELRRTSKAQHSGTTFVAGIIEGKTLTAANVGDSRLIVMRPSALPFFRLPFTTDDQKGNQVRTGLALGRTFGDIETCNRFGITSEPEISKCQLKDGDYIMVASDGYWDVCSNRETVSIITGASKAQRPCKEIAQILVQKARTRGSRDDISVLIVRYTEPKA